MDTTYLRDMNTTQTAGQELTATLRRHFRINARTRNYRDGIDMKARMREAIVEAATISGYHTPATEAGLRIGYTVVAAWEKHVEGYRIDGQLAARLRAMTPAEFAAYLGRMVDAGITNVGQAETFFRAEAHALVA